MISELLNQSYVLAQTRAQRDWLGDLLAKAKEKTPAALVALKKNGVTIKQIETAISALDAALLAAEKSKTGTSTAFIPSNPFLCAFQTGMTRMADRRANTVTANPTLETAVGQKVSKKKPKGIDTSATLRLKHKSSAGAIGPGRVVAKAPFVEGDDIHYGLDGFNAKFGALFTGRHKFNKNPAIPVISAKPLRLFVFGDWGTGLPLAQMVTDQIRKQLIAGDGKRQQHVVHLGDVYYVGHPEEYSEHVIAAGMWPVINAEKDQIGSWSLNGNHDMYSGGYGYFDQLLSEGRFLRWHRDTAGMPSSFFVIEDANWQFFGLDTAWNMPSLSNAVFGNPTLKDYGGQNGILTDEQVTWMAGKRDASKGCVLLTHHQPASSRTSEAQHADEAVKLLEKHGVYGQIDAWLWGHEHRCVVFKPKAKRTTPRLAKAPEFCACIGHGGVPVTQKNFEAIKRIRDVDWEEDRLDASSPIYEGERIIPFGFARIDTAPDALDIRFFDHTGAERKKFNFTRPGAVVAPAAATKKSPARSARSIVGRKSKIASKPAKSAPHRTKKPKAASKKRP